MKIEQRDNFDEKYPEDVRTAFLTSGKQIFDKFIVIARKRELMGFQPYRVMAKQDSNAPWRYKALFHPRVQGRRYLIGADPATGIEITNLNPDRSAAVVLDLETGEEMAATRDVYRPEEFAFDLADLGEYFNNAIIAVERTGDGGSVILTLIKDCQYNAIFKSKEWWKRERKTVDVEGFPTTVKTRPIAVNFLNAFVSEHPEMLWDEHFLDEALTFVRDEKGKPCATPEAHDDTVSCRWIAHMARRITLGYYDPVAPHREGYISAERLTAERLGAV
jgi:hypothetical protein